MQNNKKIIGETDEGKCIKRVDCESNMCGFISHPAKVFLPAHKAAHNEVQDNMYQNIFIIYFEILQHAGGSQGFCYIIPVLKPLYNLSKKHNHILPSTVFCGSERLSARERYSSPTAVAYSTTPPLAAVNVMFVAES